MYEMTHQMENAFKYLAGHKNARVITENANPEVDHKVRKVADKFSDNLYMIANEPCVAFFRIQEHVRKTMPPLMQTKHEMNLVQQQVQGRCFDTEYATNAVKAMYSSSPHLKNIQDLLKNSMFIKQQLTYEQSCRQSRAQSSGMYRGMSRTRTLDVPSSQSIPGGSSRRDEITRSMQLPIVMAVDDHIAQQATSPSSC